MPLDVALLDAAGGVLDQVLKSADGSLLRVLTAPTLVFGWGNASRGDDALGPLFIERLRALALPAWNAWTTTSCSPSTRST